MSDDLSHGNETTMSIATETKFTIAEIAEMFEKDYRTALRWTKQPNRHGKILRTVEVGGTIYVTEAALNEYETHSHPEVAAIVNNDSREAINRLQKNHGLARQPRSKK